MQLARDDDKDRVTSENQKCTAVLTPKRRLFFFFFFLSVVVGSIHKTKQYLNSQNETFNNVTITPYTPDALVITIRDRQGKRNRSHPFFPRGTFYVHSNLCAAKAHIKFNAATKTGRAECGDPLCSGAPVRCVGRGDPSKRRNFFFLSSARIQQK